MGIIEQNDSQSDTDPRQSQAAAGKQYLDDISGLVNVFLEDHHGGRVDVDVVLAGQLFDPL